MNDKEKKDMKDVLAAIEPLKCVIQRALKFVEEFLSEPMCGRCMPCSFGSYEAKIRLKKIAEGSGRQDDIDALNRIAKQMIEGSMCKKGKDTAKFLLDSLQSGSYKEHIEKRCIEKECLLLITYRIIPEKCVLCGLCREACKYNAILGEKRETYLSGYLPFEIMQKKCVKCGDCMEVCLYNAVEIIEEKIEALV